MTVQELLKDKSYYMTIWQDVSGELSNHYGESTYRNWFSKISFLDIYDSQVILAAPTNFIRDWVRANYSGFMLKVLQQRDVNIKSLEIITKEQVAPASALEDK